VLIDEEKQVDAPELERADALRDEVRAEEGLAEHEVAEQEEQEGIQAERAADVSNELQARVLGTMRDILQKNQVSVGQLGLPVREERALEALQAAVSGRSSDLATYLYASERIAQLETALAVLQPSLVEGGELDIGAEAELELGGLVDHIGRIRESLTSLEDAQDELLEADQKRALENAAAAAGETDEHPGKRDPHAPPKRKGPPPKELAPGESSLVVGGAEAPVHQHAPSQLDGGKALPERAPGPSTLAAGGAEAPVYQHAPSQLEGGKAPPDRAPAASSLGDATEIQKAAKTPWWRRPLE
jgi:hypothetical protein